MYVIRTDRRTWPDGRTSRDEHLYEMTAAEFRKAREADTPEHEGEGPAPEREVWHRRVSAEEAHEHVRADRIHSTTLYLEEGRIRRAG